MAHFCQKLRTSEPQPGFTGSFIRKRGYDLTRTHPTSLSLYIYIYLYKYNQQAFTSDGLMMRIFISTLLYKCPLGQILRFWIMKFCHTLPYENHCNSLNFKDTGLDSFYVLPCASKICLATYSLQLMLNNFIF